MSNVEQEKVSEINFTRIEEDASKFYSEREAKWSQGKVKGGCDAGASLAKASREEMIKIGMPFVEALIDAHGGGGPRVLFEARRKDQIDAKQLERYLATALFADGGEWEILNADEKVKKQFELQSREVVKLLLGEHDDKLPEISKKVEERYFPDPSEVVKDLEGKPIMYIYNSDKYPFLRGLRDGVEHQMNVEKYLSYSYMGDDKQESMADVLRSNVDKVDLDYGTFVVAGRQDPEKEKEILDAFRENFQKPKAN